MADAKDAERLPPDPTPAENCDLGEAIAFALRRVEQAIKAKDLCLLRKQSSSLAVACDRRLCRQIVTALLDGVVAASPGTATLGIEARPLKGAVLFRISVEDAEHRPALLETLAAALARTQIHVLVDQASGTMLVDATNRGACVTLRLASPVQPPAQCGSNHGV